MFHQICQLSIYCTAPNSSFTACSAKMNLGPLNIFPLPCGMKFCGQRVLERHCWGKGLSPLYPVYSSWWAPAPHMASLVSGSHSLYSLSTPGCYKYLEVSNIQQLSPAPPSGSAITVSLVRQVSGKFCCQSTINFLSFNEPKPCPLECLDLRPGGLYLECFISTLG